MSLTSRQIRYAALFHDAILKTIQEEDLLDDSSEDNAADIMYAFSSLAPMTVAQSIFHGQEMDELAFNHQINRVIFQMHGKDEGGISDEG